MYNLITNEAAKRAIIETAEMNGIMTGGNFRAGNHKYWASVRNAGCMIIGYNQNENITYYHGHSGVLAHEERGNTFCFRTRSIRRLER